MKTIALKGGGFAIVDDEDFGEISLSKWRLDTKGYAVTAVKIKGRRKFLFMHRQICKTGYEFEVDHKNGNRTDNRRSNLRIANRAENSRNQMMRSNNKSGFKGVCKRGTKWIATIGKDNRHFHLGCFSTAKLASEAYDAAALKLHGEFARTNVMIACE